jgi:hypothetical protein
MGSFHGNVNQRAYKIQIVNTTKPKIVSINGHVFTNWSWDATTKVLSINISKRNVDTDVVIESKL